MKIAVASTDGVEVSPHFGRSSCFVVFAVSNGKISGKDVRQNTYSGFAKGQCEQGTGQEHGEHDHADIVRALRDCDVVLCRGMGWRAAEELKANGLEPFVFDGDLSAEGAALAYLAGTLKSAGGFCRCHE